MVLQAAVHFMSGNKKTGMSSALDRTLLFVPGDCPERFQKACAAGADAIIVDLEDAVPPDGKLQARAALRAWLNHEQSHEQSHERPVLVRINAAGTEWFEDDLALCALPGVAGIVLPKAEHAGELARIEGAGAAAIFPLIESARGIANVQALAAAPLVRRLLFGSIDFGVDLGIEDDDEALLLFRSQLVLASRLAGIGPPVDGVTTAIDDAEQLQQDSLRARRLGFGGKLCIHPRQVAVVNRCFSPSAEEVAWAMRVLEASAAAGGAAVAVDGRMVDRPVMLRARRIIEQSGR